MTSVKYRIVQDRIGPYAGCWVIEDPSGGLIDGPFDSEDAARHEVTMRERRGESMDEVY